VRRRQRQTAYREQPGVVRAVGVKEKSYVPHYSAFEHKREIVYYTSTQSCSRLSVSYALSVYEPFSTKQKSVCSTWKASKQGRVGDIRQSKQSEFDTTSNVAIITITFRQGCQV